MGINDITHLGQRRTADEQAEDFDTAVINAMPAARAKIKQAAVAGDAVMLDTLDDALSLRLVRPGVMGNLIRTALNGDAEVTAKMLLDLINKGIEDEAENEAIKAVERAEVEA